MEIVIDGHVNSEKDAETGIPWGSPVSPILFLIYISGVFDTVSTTSPQTISVSFMDDLGFLVSGDSIQEVATSLKKIGEFIFRWGLANVVIFDIVKTEAISFSRACSKKVREEITNT